jgi:non-heme chloroperoxidase
MTTRYILIGGGVILPYMESGDPEGKPVIFLHGVTDSHRSFDLVFPHLSPSLRAIAMTQRGHGDAPRLEGPYTPKALSDDLNAFMDAMGIDAAYIVGHSMGSFAAQRFAIDRPERVLGLVLIGSFTTCGDKEDVKAFVREAVDPLTDPIPTQFAEEFQMSTIAKGVPPEFFRMAVAESRKVPARIWKACMNAMIEADHTPELGNIRAETLLMWGDKDAYFDEAEQEKLEALIPNSRRAIYEGCGHAPSWEEPQRVAADILQFVAEVESARADQTAAAQSPVRNLAGQAA